MADAMVTVDLPVAVLHGDTRYEIGARSVPAAVADALGLAPVSGRVVASNVVPNAAPVVVSRASTVV